jgi:hypothetical protein
MSASVMMAVLSMPGFYHTSRPPPIPTADLAVSALSPQNVQEHVLWEAAIQKKLTITVDERVYEGLHAVIGRRRISRFIESLVRPYVIGEHLEVAYRRMAQDEAREPRRWSGPRPPRETWTRKRGDVWWVNFEPAVGGEARSASSPGYNGGTACGEPSNASPPLYLAVS